MTNRSVFNLQNWNSLLPVLLCVFLLFGTLFPLPTHADSITPVFNQPPESNGLESALTNLIDGANNYVYLAAYSMNSDPVVNSLIDAHNRDDVTVRVVTEEDNRDKGGSYSGFKSSYDKLTEAGVPIKVDGRSSLMHHKFVVVDDQSVFMGSVNMTEKQFHGDKNNGLVINSSSIANHYKQEFQEMWGGNFGTAKSNDATRSHSIDGHSVSTNFSPGADGTDRIMDALNSADHSVYFNIFTFTHSDIADRLTELHENGIKVRGTIDAWQAGGSYYVTKIFEQLTEDRVPVRRDDYNGLLHSKYLVVDGNTSSNPVVVTGSYNWTISANDSNDENYLVIRDPKIVNAYYQEAKNTYENHSMIPDWQDPSGSPVNINTADQGTLETLDGIGPVTAGAIANDRQNNGDFKTVDELTRVDGIGSTTVNNIRDRITVGDVSPFPLNINEAPAEDLTLLDGIGTVGAQNIVDYRSDNGVFTSVDSLTDVSGIGSTTLNNIRDNITVGDVEDGVINVNEASADRLTELDGIGDVTAQKIVAERDVNGKFVTVDGLTRVDGIGSATVDNIRDEITVGDDVLININSASKSALESLSGIGPSTAQNIIDYRSNNGGFSEKSDLKNVNGIGDFTYQLIEDQITT